MKIWLWARSPLPWKRGSPTQFTGKGHRFREVQSTGSDHTALVGGAKQRLLKCPQAPSLRAFEDSRPGPGVARGSESTQQPWPCWQMQGRRGIQEPGAEVREQGSAMGCRPGLTIGERPESSAQLTPRLGTPESQLPQLCSHTLVYSVLPSGSGSGLPMHTSRAGG